MARKKSKVKPKPILFIACEGTSSEYQYFESWAETNEALEIFERINVYPDENEDRPKTTPLQLFRKAKQELDEGSANYAWVVFDKDNHPYLEETFNQAQASGVKIAFSSRSFEEWVLMHFEKNGNSFNATECKDGQGKPTNCGSTLVPNCNPTNCLTGHIRRNSYINDYSKKKNFDLFKAINHLKEVAIVNAAWLRFKSNASLHMPKRNIHSFNPYTEVDQLVLKLQGRSDKIEWGLASTNVTLSSWTINAKLENGNILLQLQHNKPQAQPLNIQFYSSSFFTTDDDLKCINCAVSNSRLLSIENGSTSQLLYQGDMVEFILQSNNQPYFVFKDDDLSVKIFIEL